MAIPEPDVQWVDDADWQPPASRLYQCRIWLCPEADGGYSVVAPLLPGLVSQGATEQEAIDNIKEAFQGIAEEYLETDGRIPWLERPTAEKPQAAIEKWILVDA